MIEYIVSKEDYKKFIKAYLYNHFRRKSIGLFFSSIFIAVLLSTNPFEFRKFIIWLIVAIIFFLFTFFLIPFFRFSIERIKKEKGGGINYGNKSINTTDQGLFYKSDKEEVLFKWETFKSVNSIERYIYLELLDERTILIPKDAFENDVESLNFIALINKQVLTKPRINYPSEISGKLQKHHIILGLFCLIPFIGLVFGIALIIDGIFKSKNHWLIVIGLIGIVVTLLTVNILKDQTWQINDHADFLEKTTQNNINEIFKEIEFYKYQFGSYPDSLQELKKVNSNVFLLDIGQGKKYQNQAFKMNYQREGNKYYLFSSGKDGIPGTDDDLFPVIIFPDSTKYGIVFHSKK